MGNGECGVRNGDWGLGIDDWGLTIGVSGLGWLMGWHPAKRGVPDTQNTALGGLWVRVRSGFQETLRKTSGSAR